MVEGGPYTARAFLAESVVDRAIIVRAPTRFVEPVPSGMTDETLEAAGLERLGTVVENDNVDTIACWSRPGAPWPSGNDDLGSWP